MEVNGIAFPVLWHPLCCVDFTAWHHWTKDSKLLPSGLIGPVELRTGETCRGQVYTLYVIFIWSLNIRLFTGLKRHLGRIL